MMTTATASPTNISTKTCGMTQEVAEEHGERGSGRSIAGRDIDPQARVVAGIGALGGEREGRVLLLQEHAVGRDTRFW